MSAHFWQPPDFMRPETGTLGEIANLFAEIYPAGEYGNLADEISRYWLSKLADTWNEKPEKIKVKDRTYVPLDPLSRIEQKTVIISYADSLKENTEPTLKTLDRFLRIHFPAVKGLHILPPCTISETRFNDGGFSQIRRDRIHAAYGTNADFESLMEKYFSMTDFVLNHVDIEHPQFQRYLDGNNQTGNCFFVFSEKNYRKRLNAGDFDHIFRPRPFPLFTIFRRKPRQAFAAWPHIRKVALINERFQAHGLKPLPHEIISLLTIFDKIKNDQMLLDEDYGHITSFKDFMTRIAAFDLNRFFSVSETQETQHTPYIFGPKIQSMQDFLHRVLPMLGANAEASEQYTEIYLAGDTELFGEPIRALTTFSHVQVDLNTTTFEGLKLLIDDFSWYLKMDLNMLRLDAANFAFKKWGTSCFGLPEVRKLLKILYLSMDAVAPRNVPNLEVNAPLSSILQQMADKQAPPPMMYDFHLPSMLPVVFNRGDARPLTEILPLIRRYDIPHDSIRFSLDESHDGKSVNGSGGADRLLTYAQRKILIDTVEANGGHIKYKSSIQYTYPADEFKQVCAQSGLEPAAALDSLFEEKSLDAKTLLLKEGIRSSEDIARALNLDTKQLQHNAALNFFAVKILEGKEPYELCISTRDSMIRLNNLFLEVKRYLAFKTLAFALMGRHVKATYFNDLLALPNDSRLLSETGELRNIKRTKSKQQAVKGLLGNPAHAEYWIARQLNNTIALVDADPSFHPRGNEARVFVDDKLPSLAFVHSTYRSDTTLIIINTDADSKSFKVNIADYGLDPAEDLIENITAAKIPSPPQSQTIELTVSAYDRLWLKNDYVKIDRTLLKDVGTEADMRAALINRK